MDWHRESRDTASPRPNRHRESTTEQAIAPALSDEASDVRDKYGPFCIWTIQYGFLTGLLIHRDELPSGFIDICIW